MQGTVLFDIAETPFRWWFCWPAALLLLTLLFPLLAYLMLDDNVKGERRRTMALICGGVGAAIFAIWLLFVGPPTLSEYLRYRQLRTDRDGDRWIEIEGTFVGGNSANSEMGSGVSLTTFVVQDNQGVRHSFTARLTESIRFSDLRPFVSHRDRLRVSYVPRSGDGRNHALRVVSMPKTAP